MCRPSILRFVLALAVLSPVAEALAQQQPPPPVVQPQQPPPPVAQPSPVQPQTVRWTLANGQVFDGYEVGGDAQFVMVQTQAGIMQVPRNQVVSAVPVASAGVMVTAAPQPMVMPPPARPRRRGRGLLIAGAVVFGVSYGLSALGGISASNESSTAIWWAVPIAGPIIWAAQTDCDPEDSVDHDACRSLALSLATFVTIVQAAGAAMLIIGISLGSSSDEVQTAARPRLALDVGPLTDDGGQGLMLRGIF